MASRIRLADFKRKFERLGVEFRKQKRGKHPKMYREIDGKMAIYPFAVTNGRWVDSVYVKGARKKLKLTEDDGVTDEEFDSL